MILTDLSIWNALQISYQPFFSETDRYWSLSELSQYFKKEFWFPNPKAFWPEITKECPKKLNIQYSNTPMASPEQHWAVFYLTFQFKLPYKFSINPFPLKLMDTDHSQNHHNSLKKDFWFPSHRACKKLRISEEWSIQRPQLHPRTPFNSISSDLLIWNALKISYQPFSSEADRCWSLSEPSQQFEKGFLIPKPDDFWA